VGIRHRIDSWCWLTLENLVNQVCHKSTCVGDSNYKQQLVELGACWYEFLVNFWKNKLCECDKKWPRSNDRQKERFHQGDCHPNCLERPFVLWEHIQAVTDVSHSSCVSFHLPELLSNVSKCPFPSLNVKLIKGRENRHRLDLSVSLKQNLQTHMHVFANGLLHCVPKAYPFRQYVAESVIGEWKSHSTGWYQTGRMHRAVHIIIGPYKHGCSHVVSGVDLGWLINNRMPVLKVSKQVFFDLLNINWWHPAVRINHSYHNIFLMNH
jgi:hypothetical protein